MGFYFLFFFAGNLGSLKTQISQKKQKPKYLAKKKKTKNPIRKMLGRGTLNPFAKFQGLSKTAWTLDSQGIWGFMLEPACMCILKLLPSTTVRCTIQVSDRYTKTPLYPLLIVVGVVLLRCCLLLYPLSPREAFGFLSFYRIMIVYRFIVIELSNYRNIFDTILSFLYRMILSKVSIRYPTLL